MLRAILAFVVVILFLLVYVYVLNDATRMCKENPMQAVTRVLQNYMPDKGVTFCEQAYYVTGYASCVLFNVKGMENVSLTINPNNGTIVGLFVMLEEPVSIGDLELMYGDPKVSRRSVWTWTWDNVTAYKYFPVGTPGPLTEVRMLSWH